MSDKNIAELIKLAHSYETQELYGKAIESCNKILQIDELNFQALAISCRCHSKSGDLEKAISFAGILIRNYPDNPDSYALRAFLCKKEGAIRNEIQHYEKALSVNSTHYESLCNLAGAYIESGKLHAAADKIKRLKEVIPGDGQVFFLEGLLKGAEQRLDDEIRLYREALEQINDCGDIWYNLGVSLMEKGDNIEAIQAFRHAMDLDTSSPDVYFNLASVFFEEKRYSDSISALEQAIKDFPGNRDLWYNLGYVQASDKQYDKAIEAYKKAVTIDNTMDDAYYNLAFIYFRRKNYEKAISAYEKVLKLNPERFNAYYNLAFSLDKCKKYEEAIEVYKKILSFRPDDHKSYSKLAMVYHHTGQIDKVKSACLRSLEMEKISNPEAHYYLGIAAESEGDFEQAASEFKKSLLQAADYKDAHLKRAIMLRKLKKYEEAKAEAKEAVRCQNSAPAYYEMGRCYSALKDNKKAMAAYKKALEKRPTHQKSIMALISILEGDNGAIIKVCEEAISNKVKSAPLYYHYALALKAEENYKQALKAAKKSLKISDDNKAVYGLIASLYSKTGNREKAQKYKKKFDSTK